MLLTIEWKAFEIRKTLTDLDTKFNFKMSSFSASALEKKLADLTSTQQSVQTLSLWIIHHRKHSKTIVQSWLKELQKGLLPHTTATDLNIKTGSSILWFLELNVWSQFLRLSFGFPIWLPKKLHWLYCLLTIAARFFSLQLIIHNIPIIIKEKGTPQWNLNLLN